MLEIVTKSKKSKNKIKTVAVIGAGHLGTSLALELLECQLLEYVVVRNPKKVPLLNYELNNEIKLYRNISELTFFPDAVFLTVQDSEIQNVAEQIAFEHSSIIANTIFIHCSGTLGLEPLKPLKEHCFGIANAHPYQTFFSEDGDDLYEIGWMIQCDNKLKQSLKFFFEDIHGYPYFADQIYNFNKDKYHISAVFASNYYATNLYYAQKLAVQTGINAELFISPIQLTTAVNMDVNDGYDKYPLTGPIARGDIITIKNHILSLKNDVLTLKSYILMGLSTVETAFAEKKIKKVIYEELKKLFVAEINLLYNN